MFIRILQPGVDVVLNVVATALWVAIGYAAKSLLDRMRRRRLSAFWNSWSRGTKDKASKFFIAVFPISTGRVGFFEMKAFGRLSASLAQLGVRLELAPERGLDEEIGTESFVTVGGLNASVLTDEIWQIVERRIEHIKIDPGREQIVIDIDGREHILEAKRYSEARVTDYAIVFSLKNKRLRQDGQGVAIGIFGLWGYGLFGAAQATVDGTALKMVEKSGGSSDDDYVLVLRVEAHRGNIVEVTPVSAQLVA